MLLFRVALDDVMPERIQCKFNCCNRRLLLLIVLNAAGKVIQFAHVCLHTNDAQQGYVYVVQCT